MTAWVWSCGGGVPVYWSGCVMFEGSGDELPGRFGGIVAADPRLGEPLQLGKRNANGLAVSLTNSLIPAHQGGQGNRFGRGRTGHPIRPGARPLS